MPFKAVEKIFEQSSEDLRMHFPGEKRKFKMAGGIELPEEQKMVSSITYLIPFRFSYHLIATRFGRALRFNYFSKLFSTALISKKFAGE